MNRTGQGPARCARAAVLGADPRFVRPVSDGLDRDGVAHLVLPDVAALLGERAETLAAIEVLCAPGYMKIDAAVMARLPGLRGLVSPFTGVEGFDRDAATARGILIGNGQIDENIESMAEATVLLLLAAAYRLPEAMASMAGGAWPRPAARGRMIKAMTIGIVGYGRIAQAVTARLLGFGCRLQVHAPRLREALPANVARVDLVDLVTTSDAIVMLASLGPDSRHLIDADLIARIKPDAIVVNTARGPLIDEAALIAAAQAGRLGAIALDVFADEPLDPDNALRSLPNAILTPHTIGHTRETIAQLPLHALAGVRNLLRGDPPPSLVNPQALVQLPTSAGGASS